MLWYPEVSQITWDVWSCSRVSGSLPWISQMDAKSWMEAPKSLVTQWNPWSPCNICYSFVETFSWEKVFATILLKQIAKSFEHTWKYSHRWKKLRHLTLRSAFVPTNLSGKGCLFTLIHLNGWCSRLTWLVDQVDWDQGDHVPNLRKFWNAVAQRHREAFNKKIVYI